MNASETTFEKAVRFLVEYRNTAWGYQHNGLIIDASGEVFAFDAASEAGADPEVGRYRHVTRVGRVSVSTLAKHLALATEAAAGAVTPAPGIAMDAGAHGATAFLVDPKTGQRRAVELGTLGASAAGYTNDSPAAARLLKWLEDVRQEAQRTTDD